ncbi:MAG TPA: hypothetical protein VJ647_04200 [Chitinophagaceae bacterium]|nr:hypothetical protein [Chitinophagaceae bacterium]
MQNILIPTDFTAQSLQFVSKTAAALQGEKINIVLFHAFNLPDDIVDLMFISREKVHQGLVSDEFRNQCRKLKNLYFDTIHSIHVKYMYGSTVRMFKNFADANTIDMIVLPGDLRLQLPHKYSFDPVPLLKKAGIKTITSPEAPPAKVWITTEIKVKEAESAQLTRI